MTRTFLSAVAAVALASCSVIDPDENGLTERWRASGSTDVVLTGRLTLDATHAYAVRDRALVAFDLDSGAEAWRRPVSNACTPTPAAAGRVFCPSDRLHAFDAASGEVLWTATPDSTLLLVSATADANRVYVGTLSSISAYSAATGERLWRRSLKDDDWLGTRNRALVLDGSTLFATTERTYNANGFLSASAIVALDPATGTVQWRFQDGDGSDSQKIGGLTVTPETLLYSDPENGQQIVAVDRATRSVRWRVRRQPGFLGTLQAPSVADGVAYQAEGDEHLYALDVTTGAVVWDVQPDRGSYRNHAVCGDLFVGDNSALTVLRRDTGDRVEVRFGRSSEDVRQLGVRGRRLVVATDQAVYGFDC